MEFLIFLLLTFRAVVINSEATIDIKVIIIGEENQPIELNIINNEVVISKDLFNSTDYRRTRFICESKAPIIWIPSGPNYKNTRSFDIVEERIPGNDENIFRSTLRFNTLRNENTGGYACQSKQNPIVTKIFYALFYLTPLFFAPGTTQLFTENYGLSENETIFITADEQEGIAVIPMWSNVPPNLKIEFFKGIEETPLDDFATNNYANREGLTIDFTSIQNIAEAWGPYTFSVEDYNPLGQKFTLRPAPIYAPTESIIEYTRNTPIILRCEHKDGVKFLYPTPSDPTQPVYDHTVGTWQIMPTDYPYGKTFSCARDVDTYLPETFKSWTLARSMEPTVTMTYNQETRLHKCCTSYHRMPRIDKKVCNTIAQCEFDKNSMAYNPSYNNDYNSTKPNPGEECVEEYLGGPDGDNKPYSYLASCSVEYIPETYQFKIMSIYDGVDVPINYGTINPRSFGMGCRESHDGHACVGGERLEVEFDDKVVIECYAERSYYGLPKLEMEFKNRTKKEFPVLHYDILNLGENYWQETVKFTFDSTEIKQINCISPPLDDISGVTMNEIPVTVNPKISSTTEPAGSAANSLEACFYVYLTAIIYLRNL